MSDTCSVGDARIILPDLIEQVRALSRPVVLTAGDQEPVAALVPAAWLDRPPAGTAPPRVRMSATVSGSRTTAVRAAVGSGARAPVASRHSRARTGTSRSRPSEGPPSQSSTSPWCSAKYW